MSQSTVHQNRVDDLLDGDMFVTFVNLLFLLLSLLSFLLRIVNFYLLRGWSGFATCFFRVFRALRLLRSLNRVPQMKKGGDVGERRRQAC